MASIAWVRTNQLVDTTAWFNKTGDGSVELTKQSIASMIKQFGVIAKMLISMHLTQQMLWLQQRYHL